MMTRRTPLALLALALAAPAAAQFPTAPPDGAPLAPLRFPPFQEATLRNGLRLILVENHQLPIVSFSLGIPSGAVSEPAAMRGLAGMTAELLTKGTATRTAEEISARIEGVGGSLNAGAGVDFFSLSSTVLTEHADLAFELAADVLLHPAFPQTELDLARRRTLSGLRLERSQPAAVAARFFARELYGDHPYGQAPTEETVGAITREAVQQFAAEQLKPQGALLVVAGDLTLPQARALAERHLAGWTGRAPARSYGRPPQARPTEILLVHRPGSEQSNILLGNLALRPGDGQYYATVLANKVLGGGADARLFQILREERSWTYGAYSNVSRPFDVGRFQASAEVRTPVTDSALAELLHQVRRMRDERIPDSTLQAAKGFLTGVFPLTIETPGQVAGQVSTQERLGLGSDYLRRYRERLAAVTADQARAAARLVMRPDSAVIVVVGDGTAIYEGLRAIGTVRIIDVEGNRLTPEDLTAPPAGLTLDPALLTARTDSLRVMAQGREVGSMVTQVTVAGDSVIVREAFNLAAFGVQQGSRTVLARDLTLRAYQQDVNMGGQRGATNLTYDGNHVTGQAFRPPRGPGATGTTVDIDTTLAAGVVDANYISTVLPALALAPGASFTVTAFDPTDGSTRAITVAVEGSEDVTVPAGTFGVYRVSLTGGPQAVTFYVTRDAPRRIIKFEITGAPIAAELVQ